MSIQFGGSFVFIRPPQSYAPTAITDKLSARGIKQWTLEAVNDLTRITVANSQDDFVRRELSEEKISGYLYEANNEQKDHGFISNKP
ncbi:MAG: hypothetical protein K2X66_04670 [Cyanobacteria bacterium]|nr:hypothetical protein [Cyanobacteriota bacterium]